MGGVTILDGGMSRELLRLGAPLRQPEWTALALIESPDHVRRAHQSFAEAGADVLTVNAYAVVPYHLGDRQFAASGRQLASTAAELARGVADGFGVRVAGCVPPPLGSFRPEAFDEASARPILETLVEAQAPAVDVWLAETMSSVAEAELAARVVAEGSEGVPLWMAFTVDDRDGTRLRSGEPVLDAVRAAEVAGAEVVGFNCSRPEALEDAARVAHAVTELPIGVYANVLHDHTSTGANEVLHETRLDATPEAYCEWAGRWVDAGVTVVGGCCGTTADHIGALTAHFGGR